MCRAKKKQLQQRTILRFCYFIAHTKQKLDNTTFSNDTSNSRIVYYTGEMKKKKNKNTILYMGNYAQAFKRDRLPKSSTSTWNMINKIVTKIFSPFRIEWLLSKLWICKKYRNCVSSCVRFFFCCFCYSFSLFAWIEWMMSACWDRIVLNMHSEYEWEARYFTYFRIRWF